MTYRMVYPVLRLIVRACFALFGGYRVEGRERFPRAGGVILTPNHISDIDHFAVALAVNRPLWFMAKSDLFGISWLRPLILFLQAFPVHREQPDREALRRAETLLSAGEAVVIYPEGQDSLDGKLQPLNPGAAMIALRAQAPVAPVAVRGTSRVMPVGRLIPKLFAAKTVVEFGDPIMPAEVPAHLTSRQKREWLNQRIYQSLLDLLQQTQTP